MTCTVAVYGAGIAGLSAAHELAERGFQVTVFEAQTEAGGFARSAMDACTGIPTEYSWRGFGPWYSNCFNLMQRIPGRIFECGLSRPIHFSLLRNQPGVSVLSAPDWLKLVWLLWWNTDFSSQALARLQKTLSADGAHTVASTFGPWIGTGRSRTSLGTARLFFLLNLFTTARHWHQGVYGAPWVHQKRDGWLLLRGPSSQVWFEPWTRYLRDKLGVTFHFRTKLVAFNADASLATVQSEASSLTWQVRADYHVVAVTPFAAYEVVKRCAPSVQRAFNFPSMHALLQDGPHIQVSFQVAFAEPVNLPPNKAVILVDSPFNITFFPMEHVWDLKRFSMGPGVVSLWSCTACEAEVPGILYGLPLSQLSQSQFIHEVWHQMCQCCTLQQLLQSYNQGRKLRDFKVVAIPLWHEWEFANSSTTATQVRSTAQIKWVNSFTNDQYRPGSRTGFPRVFVCGAHTQTSSSVWGMEGAAESGRRAASHIVAHFEGQGVRPVEVITQTVSLL